MTNISTAFAEIKTMMGTLFTENNGYYQLTNPYDIEENTETMHEKGWGVALGPGTNTNRQLCNRLSINRTIVITLTRRRFANELDTESKESAEKSILEDQFTLIQNIELYPSLNNSVSGITKFVYVSDGGIEAALPNSDAYIKLASTFEMEYFESLVT